MKQCSTNIYEIISHLCTSIKTCQCIRLLRDTWELCFIWHIAGLFIKRNTSCMKLFYFYHLIISPDTKMSANLQTTDRLFAWMKTTSDFFVEFLLNYLNGKIVRMTALIFTGDVTSSMNTNAVNLTTFPFLWCYPVGSLDHSDVIMDAMASQITSLTIIYSTVYSDADHRRHQSSASLAFVRGIHRSPVNSPHNGQWRGKCFHLMTSSYGDTWGLLSIGAPNIPYTQKRKVGDIEACLRRLQWLWPLLLRKLTRD